MQVSRIEVFGFKSFMERLILPLDGGVTGVVGPNGCGKSNIVDALRWVLGETRAKSLRGGVLEDVIFNGTDRLRPLGLAEVTITLRASNENFFADLVSPALEAELLAKEAAEQVVAREEEDAGVAAGSEETNTAAEGDDEASEPEARPQLRVIEGNLGKEEFGEPADTIESAGAPGENGDAVSEDAAEVAESDEAEEEASGVSASLLHRFSWLKACNEVQVTRRLYRSGESEFFINRVQCRLKDIKELFRAVGLGPRAYTIVAQGEVARIITAKPEERRAILEEAAGVQGFRDKIAASGRRLDETEVNISRLDDIIKEVTRQVNSLKRQAAKARSRKDLKEEVATLEQALFRDSYIRMRSESQKIEQLYADLKREEQSLTAAFQKERAREEEARNSLMSIDVAGDDLRNKIDAIKEELAARQRVRGEKTGRIAELEAFRQARETELKRLEERKQTLRARTAECEQSVAEFKQEEDSLGQQAAAIDLSGADTLKELSTRLESLRSQLKNKEREFRTAREALISRQSSLESIEEQLIAASPVQQLKNSLKSDEFETLRALTDKARLLVDGLKIPEKYTKAVQAVLSERAAFLVADNPHEIARGYIQAVQKAAKTRGLGLGVLRSGSSTSVQSADVPFPLLESVLEVAPDCSLAIGRLLAGVYVAESAAEAFSFFEGKSTAEPVVVVTLSGEVVTPYSFYALQHEGGVVQLKQRADRLKIEIADFAEQANTLDAQRDELAEQIDSTEKEHAQVLRDFQARQAESRELSNRLGNVRGRLQAESRLLEQVRQDEERLVRQEGEAQNKLQQYTEEIQVVRDELAAMQSDDESAMHAELRELNGEYMTLDARRSEERKVLSELASTVSSRRNELDTARTRLSDSELRAQKIELEREHIAERVLEEYGEHLLQELGRIGDADAPLDDEERKETKERVSKIRARIAREGDVDPTSIERLEEEETRLNDLQSQRDDLHTAAITLKRTIDTLTETSEKRFLQTFAAVQKNFSALTPRLFGGGKGSIELLDPDNPLDTGVEIIARPPGKKLKSIELLSGGEKALCATALVFSMFLERPSPLCVLDEVDAPLDEANLMRFVSLVKEMSKKTQFIMITHNKASMALADRLVGVTMPEPGASKIISVSLQEAYEQVA